MQERWRQIIEATRSVSRLRWAGIAFSLLIVAGAVTVLFRIFSRIKVEDVVAAFSHMRPEQIALAALFSAGSYLSLTAYDFFALRTIGRSDVPYRVAALAGFSAYSIGHNIGATTISCGIVRYHVYSSRLGVIEVAKICFVTGLTFWLGNITVLGIGLAYDPAAAGAIDQLPSEINRVIGLGLLAACLCYLAWVGSGERVMGRNNWQVTLPNGRSTVIQIAIGVFDLTCCALAMWSLMPDTPPIAFVTLTVVFASSMLLGYASSAPGGIGVFDAAMLIALPSIPPETLIARLLVFRLVCYVIPALVALSMLGIRQICLARESSFASQNSRTSGRLS